MKSCRGGVQRSISDRGGRPGRDRVGGARSGGRRRPPAPPTNDATRHGSLRLPRIGTEARPGRPARAAPVRKGDPGHPTLHVAQRLEARSVSPRGGSVEAVRAAREGGSRSGPQERFPDKVMDPTRSTTVLKNKAKFLYITHTKRSQAVVSSPPDGDFAPARLSLAQVHPR